MINDKSQKIWCILELAKEQNDETLCYEFPSKEEDKEIEIPLGIDREYCIDQVRP